MNTLKEIATYPIMGAPIWQIIAGLLVLGVADFLVKRAKSTRAESIFQWLCIQAKETRIASIPLVGDVVKAIAAGAPAFSPAETEQFAKVNGVGNADLLDKVAKMLIVGVLGASLAACATARTDAYGTLNAAASWAETAAKQLPPACEARLKAIVAAAPDRATADAGVAPVEKQCDAAKAGIKAAIASLVLARDAVKNAPVDSADAKTLAPWIKLGLGIYADLGPVLAPFGVVVPGVQ